MDKNTHINSGISEPSLPPGHPPPYSASLTPQPAMGVTFVPVTGTAMFMQQMGPNATKITCKSCHQEIITTTKSKPNTRTHIIALILCSTLMLPCMLIPYCTKSCMNTEHYCPNCESYIGVHIN